LIVTTIFDQITDALAHGGRAELRGFGAFTVRRRDARPGRNSRTGEPVALPGILPARFVDATSEMFRQHGVQFASGSAARIYIGLTDTTQAMVRERADNPKMRSEYVARVIQGMPAALR
jgi:hypothetical protein